MIDTLSPEECKQLQNKFAAKKEKQSALWLAYEQGKCYGMAYLALWAVVEDFAVHLGPMCLRLQLRRELTAWIEYLDDSSLKASPGKISAGKFDIPKGKTAKIPPDSQLQLILPSEAAPNLYAVLATKKKFRDKRNAIAHSGEDVSERVYEEFKVTCLAAVAEIQAWLNSINSSGARTA